MAMNEHLATARAIAREVRRRIASLAGKLSRSRRADLVRMVRKELKRAEPLLAGTIRDAQILAWIEATTGQVQKLDLPAVFPAEKVTNRLFPETSVILPQVEAAARSLASKVSFNPQEFAGLEKLMQRNGFTVARAASLDAVEKVKQALAEDVRHGGTLRQFRDKVGTALEDSGLGDFQVESLYRTHVARAYSAGQQDVLDTPLVGDEFPYVEYSATHDGRVRQEHLDMEHLGLNGTAVYRADDPVIRRLWPPWGWNCRCIVIPLSIEDAAAKGVREAIRWLRTGERPETPEHVRDPGFQLPKGWVPISRETVAVMGA